MSDHTPHSLRFGCTALPFTFAQVSQWSGSLEIGVTATDPSSTALPPSATGLRASTWLLSGCSVLRDGRTLTENYGRDLDLLREGERVGVMRTAAGALHFYVNGVELGAAVDSGVPEGVYAVVDLYGKCAQVTVMQDEARSELTDSGTLCDTACKDSFWKIVYRIKKWLRSAIQSLVKITVVVWISLVCLSNKDL